MKTTLILLYLTVILTVPSFAILGLQEDGSLDKKKISEMYFEGDFKQVEEALISFKKSNPNASDEDKILMYKYLSVIYTSNPDTKDKGESYMYQLIKLRPTVKLLDMYISDNIESIFRNVKKKHNERMAYIAKKEDIEGNNPTPEPKKSQNSPASKKSSSWIWYTAAGITIVGGVIAFILLGGDEDGQATKGGEVDFANN